jgi:hypothetical protein
MGEQERQTPAPRLFWDDPTQPMLPPEGLMPGRPGINPTAPLLGDRPPILPGGKESASPGVTPVPKP